MGQIDFSTASVVFGDVIEHMESALGNSGLLMVLGVSLVMTLALTVLSWVRRG